MSPVLRGAGGGGSKQPRTPVEAPDSLQSIARARLLDLLGEGEIEGFATENVLESIFLDETPIANPDGSLNFVDVQVDTRLGTQHQDHIAGFPAVENELGISQELRPETPFVRQVTNLQLSAVNIRISTPQLSKADTSNGDIQGHSVRYAIDLAVDGGAYVTVLNSAITGKTTTKYERSHRVDLPAANSGWIVRVRRLTAMANSASVADLTFIESMTEVIDGKFRYPNSALAGLGIDAAQFGRIPTRAYNVLGRRAAVPSNYNPVTRAYTGVWDGTFKQAWTNNPAWGYYDLIINDRFGLGDRISEGQIDKWTLYTIARYCDGMVPDGRGGMEPRFTAAIRLTTRDQALKVLQDIASIFRSMAYWAGGSVMSVADMPADPVYTYHNGNVIDGRFTYSGSSGRARHTVALVSWSDPDDFGRQKIEYVPDDDGIARYGINQTEVIAFGCQSQGQAQRLGKWILLTEKLETDTVTFGAALDATVAMPGQIIGVADSLRAGRRIGGRVRSATSSQITVDALPEVAVGDALTCVMPDAVSQTRIVSSISGNTLTVSVPYTGTPVPDAAWSIRSTELHEQRFRVLEVKEEDGIQHTITALRHVEGKFDAVEHGIEVQLPPITSLPARVQLPPTGLVIEHRDVAGENTSQTVVSVRWDAVPGAVAYDVEWRQGQGGWIAAGRSHGTSMDIYGVLPGDFEFKVTAVNAVGLQSPPVHEGPYDVPENASPPRAIAEITRQQVELQEAIDQANADRVAGDLAAVEAAGLDATAKANAARDSAIARVDALAAEIGEIVNAPEWAAGETYIVGWLVRADGGLYRAKVENTDVPPAANPATWEYLGQFASVAEVAAAALQLATVTATELEAEAIRINSLQSRMPAAGGVLETKARVDQVDQASVDRDGALAQSINTVGAQAGNAQSSATSAMTAAQNAASIANSAQTAAGNAQSTATSALSTAEGAALAVTQVQANQTGSGNRLENAEQSTVEGSSLTWDLLGWPLPTLERNLAGDAWRAVGTNNFGLVSGGSPAANQQAALRWTKSMSCEPGDNVIAAARLANHRSSGFIRILFLRANGTEIDSVVSPVNTAQAGGQSLQNWFVAVARREGGAPADTSQAVLQWWSQGTGEANPYSWITQPQMEIGRPGQTEPSPWSAGAAGLGSVTQELRAGLNSTTGRMEAIAGLAVRADGKVIGYRLANDGVVGRMDIVGDAIAFLPPDGAASGMEFTPGNTVIRQFGAGWQRITSAIPFGPDALTHYYGPNVGIAAASKAFATKWEDANGHVYTGGSFSAGVLRQAAQSTQFSTTATVDTGSFTTNGRNRAVASSLSYENSGRTQTSLGADVALTATVVVERSRDNGATWAEITRFNASGQRTFVIFEPGVGYTYQFVMNGSSTYTDTTGGTANVNYRLRIIAASGPWPYNFGSGATPLGRQSLAIVSTEQPA